MNHRHRLFALVCLALFLTGPAGAAPLVQVGSVWKYLDNGTDQSNAWRTVEYDDDGWASGPAQLGFGDGDEVTEVGYGPDAANKYITTYFRQTFISPDPSTFSNLVLRLVRDDGAVVYLNGVEVFRSNMPTGAITHLTLASTSTSTENAFRTNIVNATNLVEGVNILAVEVHQSTVDSSDLSFDLELTDGRNDTPIASITSPANNSTIPNPGNVTITVSAVDPNGTITNVQFFAGNTFLGQTTNAPFTFIWTNVSEGTHVINVVARDNDGFIGLSPAVKFTVTAGSISNFTHIAAGSVWKYHDQGLNLGTAWSGTGFDDSTWTNGPAQFGYGDGDEARVLSFGTNTGNKYITTYFRKTFPVADPAQVSDLVLQMVLDDGAVVYLNDTEAFRTNLPAGPVTFTTLASASWENKSVRAILDKSLLVTGDNLIAVEVHQQTTNSSDLSFDLELLGSDLPSVLRGPWLQSLSWTNVIVKWRTAAPVTGVVRYGTNAANLPFSFSSTSPTNEHRVVLAGLVPNQKYFYSVGTTNATLQGDATYHFTTSPLPGARQRTRVWALGDSGTANVDQFNVRNAFYRALGTNELDLILLLGDNAYNAGLDSEYQKALFDAYPTQLRKTPLWPTIGNHETAQSANPTNTIPYYQIFSTPQNGEAGGVASGTPDYYSFDHANIHFVCLDSMISSRSSTGAMAQWLTNDLAGTTQTWLVAFWHHPPYTKGSHNSDTESELVQMRQNLLPHLENYGVDLVLTGHSHAYERSHLLDRHYGTSGTLHTTNLLDTTGGRADVTGPYLKSAGTAAHNGAVYVVAGTAGKASGGSLNHPAMFFSRNRLGSLYFEVNGDRLDAQFIRETGAIDDRFTIVKGAPLYRLVRVGTSSRITWNTVLGETYQLDYKDDLNAGSWTSLGANITGTGLPVTVTNTTSQVKRSYRIRTQ